MKKLIYIVVFLAGVSFVLKSQSLPIIKPIVYTAPNGKLYVNKKLPIYFKISTSPDDTATNYLLKSESTPKYANPMYLDAEGYNSFRSPSAVDTITKQTVYPLMDVMFEIYADGMSPITNYKITASKQMRKQSVYYVGDSSFVSLISTDAVSGVKQIYYSINEAAFTLYSAPILLANEIKYTIKYFAVDYVGNMEVLRVLEIFVDRTAPDTELEVVGDAHESNHSVRTKIKLAANDEIAGLSKIFYRIDAGIFKPYIAPISVSSFIQGDHTLEYYSVDQIGNKEEVKEYAFYADYTPPSIIEEIVGKSFMAGGREYASGVSKLKLTSFDNKSGVKSIYYSINNSEYKLYEKPVTLSELKGNLKISSYAIDNVNNKSIVNAGASALKNIPYIDLSGPTLSYSFSGPVFYMGDSILINEKTRIILSGKDGESGLAKIEYQLSGGSIDSYTAPFTISPEGLNEIKYYAYDQVDNVNTSTFKVIVDNQGPEISHVFSLPPKGKLTSDSLVYDVYPSHMVLFLSATDAVVGYDNMTYSVNKKPHKPYLGQIKEFLNTGYYEVEVMSHDKLGNKSMSKISFFISEK